MFYNNFTLTATFLYFMCHSYHGATKFSFGSPVGLGALFFSFYTHACVRCSRELSAQHAGETCVEDCILFDIAEEDAIIYGSRNCVSMGPVILPKHVSLIAS